MSTQADQAGQGAAEGAAVGASVGSAAEAVPVIGPVVHALAAVIGAIGGAIAGATKDTFHPSPAQAEAWLWIFRLYPGMVFSGVDNAIAPERGARLVRYFRLVSGEVPLPPGQNLYNPNNESCDTPYMCESDPREPLTDGPTLDRIFKSWDVKRQVFTLPGPTGYVATPDEARALLALFRASPDAFRDVAGWSELVARKGIVLARIRRLRWMAGEAGPDADLAATFGGEPSDVDPSATTFAGRPLPPRKDARLAGLGPLDEPAGESPAHQFTRAAVVGALVFGGYGLLRHVMQQQKRKR